MFVIECKRAVYINYRKMQSNDSHNFDEKCSIVKWQNLFVFTDVFITSLAVIYYLLAYS